MKFSGLSLLGRDGMKLLSPVVLALILYSCASDHHRLTVAGRRVKISQRLPPQAYCRELGEVYASSLGKSDELAVLVRDTRNQLRNLTARKGGNYVTIETNNSSTFSGQLQVVFSGTAYKCVLGANKSLLKGQVAPPKKTSTKTTAPPAEPEEAKYEDDDF
jgi:hypothetical protein